MDGTFASFAKILALQSHDIVSEQIFGVNFTDVEINMQYQSSVFMDGAVVFIDGNNQVSCRSELRRIAGMFLNNNHNCLSTAFLIFKLSFFI